jgi:hypothetical protein
LFQKLKKLYESVTNDHCILIVSLHRFPNFSEMEDHTQGVSWVVSPVIKYIPYVRAFDVSYIEFSKYVKGLYANEEILLIPVKFHWVLRFISHGSNYNQNYQLVARSENGLKCRLIRNRKVDVL